MCPLPQISAVKVAATVSIGVLLAASHWKAYTAGYANADNALRVQVAAADRRAADAARKKEQEHYDQIQEAQHAAQERENKLQVVVVAARTERDRLRDDLAAVKRQLPELTEAAVRQYAVAAGAVFAACVDEYTDMAQTADRLASERQALIDSWPK